MLYAEIMMTNMPDKKPTLDMLTIRTEIDRVDTALVNLIAERMELAQAVRRAKSGVDVWRPSREESHIRELVHKASDISPDLVSRILAELTSASLSLQGPIQLHVSLAVDALSARTMVRDRFGAAIPTLSYPTESAALASAQADPEGVAVLPAPGGMHNWWTALGPQGAASNMHILSALPRVGKWVWPQAVAVSKAALLPSGADQALVYCETSKSEADMVDGFKKHGLDMVVRANVEQKYLLSFADYLTENDPRFDAVRAQGFNIKIIGILPDPIDVPTSHNS